MSLSDSLSESLRMVDLMQWPKETELLSSCMLLLPSHLCWNLYSTAGPSSAASCWVLKIPVQQDCGYGKFHNKVLRSWGFGYVGVLWILWIYLGCLYKQKIIPTAKMFASDLCGWPICSPFLMSSGNFWFEFLSFLVVLVFIIEAQNKRSVLLLHQHSSLCTKLKKEVWTR